MMMGAILSLFYTVTATLLLGGAMILFLRSTGNRSRKVLAWVMLLWGVLYLFRILSLLLDFMDYTTDLFPPSTLVLGNLSVIVLIFYPLEIVLPGWLSLRRLGFLLLPYLTVVGIYYVALAVLGEKPLQLFDYDLLWCSIGQFNVWYRLVIVFSLFGYLGISLRIALRCEQRYWQWCGRSCAADEQVNISWIHRYGYGVMLIGVTYLVVTSCGHSWCLAVHNLTVIVVFALILYKELFYDNSYLERLLKYSTDEAETDAPIFASDTDFTNDFSDESFASRLPGYITAFEAWMKDTRPYRRQDFKLVDVMQVLPLNRTYLSRVFNEGMSCSFSMVVRSYRIAEAKQLLITHPELSVKRISEQCGFSSSSSFNRTFVLCEVVTPNQYRKDILNG